MSNYNYKNLSRLRPKNSKAFDSNNFLLISSWSPNAFWIKLPGLSSPTTIHRQFFISHQENFDPINMLTRKRIIATQENLISTK